MEGYFRPAWSLRPLESLACYEQFAQIISLLCGVFLHATLLILTDKLIRVYHCICLGLYILLSGLFILSSRILKDVLYEVPATLIVIDSAITFSLLIHRYNDLSGQGCTLFSCGSMEELVIVWIYITGVVTLLAHTIYHLAFGSPSHHRRGLAFHFVLNWCAVFLGAEALTYALPHEGGPAWFAFSIVMFAIVTFSCIRWFPKSLWDPLCLFVFFYLNAGAVLCVKVKDFHMNSDVALLVQYLVPLFGSVCFTWTSVRGVLGMFNGACLPASRMDFRVLAGLPNISSHKSHDQYGTTTAAGELQFEDLRLTVFGSHPVSPTANKIETFSASPFPASAAV